MPWESWIKPENCPGPCAGCEPGDHHWMEDSLDPSNEGDQGHPALRTPERWRAAIEEGGLMIFQCKHCDAWKPIEDEDLVDDDHSGDIGASDFA